MNVAEKQRQGRAGRLAAAPAKMGLLVAACVAALSANAWAQSNDDVIIVTAQKREESVQEVPIAITVFGQDRLDKLDVIDIQDFALRTPGLAFGNYTDLKLSPTAMRGVIASTGSAGADPSVGYYLDEVFLGPGVGVVLDLFDVERIEVLRGPQGTLFGRNTIGGVVNIISKRPGDAFSGSIEGEYGNYDHTRIRGRVSGPVAPGVMNAAISGLYFERDGYTENRFLGEEGDDTLRRALSASVDFFPHENVTIEINADYSNIRQNSKNFETQELNPAGLVAVLSSLNGHPVNDDPTDRVIFSDFLPRERLESWGGSARVSVDFGGVEFITVTGYREHDYFNIGDTDVSPLDIGHDGDPEKVSRFSQEIRLASTDEGRFNWLLGGYFLDQSTDNQSFIELGRDLSLALTMDPDALDGVRAGSSAQLETESYAVFGNASYAFTEQFDVTVGGRFTYEEKSILYNQNDPVFLLGGTIVDLAASDDWSAFTPSVTARYRWPGANVVNYVTVSRGFKSGGFNDALGDVTGISFDPEYLWNYEAGIKSTWFDTRLTVNAAVFYMQWKDIQLRSDNPATPAAFDPITLNAGKAHSTGLEVEYAARLADEFSIDGFFTVLEAEFDEGVVPTAPPATPIPLDKLPRAPEYTIGFGAEYVKPLGSGFELLMRGDVIHEGESYLSLITGDPDSKVSPHTTLNARVALSHPDQGWRIAFWAKNLTDETYRVRLFELFDNPLVGADFSVLNPPRTYGVELRKDF